MEALFLTPEQQARKAERESVERERLEHIDRLVAQFNGAIKYLPLLTDHPKMSDEECLAFAREWHAVAAKRYETGDPKWNNGIPYCRNVWKVPT